MVVGFTTAYIYAISADHHWCCEFEYISIMQGECTTLCDKVCQWLATGPGGSEFGNFVITLISPGPPVSSTNNNLPPRYSWNIVESGAKQHQTNKQISPPLDIIICSVT